MKSQTRRKFSSNYYLLLCLPFSIILATEELLMSSSFTLWILIFFFQRAKVAIVKNISLLTNQLSFSGPSQRLVDLNFFHVKQQPFCLFLSSPLHGYGKSKINFASQYIAVYLSLLNSCGSLISEFKVIFFQFKFHTVFRRIKDLINGPLADKMTFS